ncbi:MAG: spermine synthase [Opitutae bacterium]|jgi:spermidine synthase|nr:spermine synthase [Opitutae bacterium]
MKPRVKLAESTTADGGAMALYEHDGKYCISYAGQELMHSGANASEILLGEIGVELLEHDAAARILIGGLGLGFTLRSVLASTGPNVVVELIELLPEIVSWNREYLKSLNGELLDDPRLEIHTTDVVGYVRKAERARYDVILLDVDNGPVAMVSETNVSLYSNTGLRWLRGSLKPEGRAVFWSAGPDLRFEDRLKRAGFRVSKVPAKVHAGSKRAAYLLYVANYK